MIELIEFIVIVESSADARTATKLAERVLVEKIDWLDAEMLQHHFQWSGLEAGTENSCRKNINHIIEREKESGFQPQRFLRRNKKGQKTLQPDGANTIKILNLVSHLQKTRQIKAVLLIRDLDNQPQRREGIDQARSEHINRPPKLEIIIGTPNRMREAWVLNGFIPSDREEEQILKEITTQLTFNPCEESHRLRNSLTEPDRLRNPKVVVEKLTGGKMEREQQCWEETSLEYLREKGDRTGLTAYIKEIEERLIPIIGSAE